MQILTKTILTKILHVILLAQLADVSGQSALSVPQSRLKETYVPNQVLALRQPTFI